MKTARLVATLAILLSMILSATAVVAQGDQTANYVSTGYTFANAKIDGRAFFGLFGTGEEGGISNWSTSIPDAKIRFTWCPSDRVTLVTRFSANNTVAGNLDYLYLDYRGVIWPCNTMRLGQRKIDFGQETWTDNPVENILITPSISDVNGLGIGLAAVGDFYCWGCKPVYELGFVNGPRGVATRPEPGLPFNVKIGTPLPYCLFASASYFDSSELDGADLSALSIAGIATAPTGATEWKRTIWEFDLRYNYGPKGLLPVVPYDCIPDWAFGATYGTWSDDATGVADRDGSYWFVEGLHSLNDQLYAAARYSRVDLDDAVLAPLGNSPVPVNSYSRTSVGLGYKLTNLVVLKTEYAFNRTEDPSQGSDLDQYAIGLATKF